MDLHDCANFGSVARQQGPGQASMRLLTRLLQKEGWEGGWEGLWVGTGAI